MSKYISDIEETTQYVSNRIQGWNSTYKKLKELRWKRNLYAHEGRIEYNEADIRWLECFYERIMSQEDPLALKFKLNSKPKIQNRDNSLPTSSSNSEPINNRENKLHKTLVFLVAAWLLGIVFFLCIFS